MEFGLAKMAMAVGMGWTADGIGDCGGGREFG